jgi:hypothetical protein
MRPRSVRRLGLIATVACVLPLGLAAPASAEPTTAVISGVFVSASSGPIASARAQALNADSLASVAADTTAADGSYTLTVPPGDYVVSFSIFGRTDQFVPQKDSPFGATRFTVAAGDSLTVNETAIPMGRISGRLVDASGAPVVDSDVRITNEQTTRLVGRTREDGRYESVAFPAGRYRIGFSLPGNFGAVQYVPGKLVAEEATLFEVPAEGVLTVDERLLATGFLAGLLEQTDGAPLAGASITVLNAEVQTGAGFARTGADGRFRVEVFPGRYKLLFNTPDFSRFQYITGAKTFEDATTFTVEAGRDTTVTDRVLPTGEVRVTAVDARTGARIADFCAGAEAASGCSGGSGEVRLTGVVAGPTSVFAYAEDGSYHGESVTTTVVGNASVDLTVRLRPAAVIQTVVRDTVSGQPVEGVCVQYIPVPRPSLGDSTPFCSDAAGVLRLGPLDGGSYKLFVRPSSESGYGMQWVGPNGGTGDHAKARTVRAVEGTVTRAPDIKLDRAGTIAGRVTAAADGAPIVNGLVSLASFHPGAGPAIAVQTGPDGRYEMPGLGPYDWPLLFLAQGKPNQWSGAKANRLAAQKIRVTIGGTTQFDAAMVDGATITGRTSTEGGWIIATNVLTGDRMGAAEGINGRYTMEVLGVQVVQMSGGGPKTPLVVVPRQGTRTADLV